MQPIKNEEPKTFTDFLRRIFKNVLLSIAGFFNRLGLTPNGITLIGLLGNLAAGLLLGLGELLWGGLLAMVIGPLDALDGVLARIQKRDGKTGAFFDSVSDRYSEIFLYGGLLIYFIRFRPDRNLLLVFLAVTGSVMVSYTRARAESLNFSAKIGLLSRAERYLILIPGLIFGYPQISLWILAALTHFTALQRIWFVGRQAKLIEKQENN